MDRVELELKFEYEAGPEDHDIAYLHLPELSPDSNPLKYARDSPQKPLTGHQPPLTYRKGEIDSKILL
ncbi:hypothetical protein WA026_008835 [Henosepilachna vigintioctopunctata]|uniref:Uncharacterized protein n=1 Tax=Henosepilachna vigintioctopunctata TaxID=420089 RepID=A0AAW1VCD7_9CUCU